MKRHILFIILIPFCLYGCISKKSHISPISQSIGIPFDGKIEKLFVVIDLPNNKGYSEKLSENLKEQFNNQNIKCESYIKTKLDLNSGKEFAEMASKAGASHIMTIDLSSQFYDETYNKTLKYFSLTIYDRKGKIQYSASLNQDLRLIKNANQAKNDAKLIVEELKKNNILKE